MRHKKASLVVRTTCEAPAKELFAFLSFVFSMFSHGDNSVAPGINERHLKLAILAHALSPCFLQVMQDHGKGKMTVYTSLAEEANNPACTPGHSTPELPPTGRQQQLAQDEGKQAIPYLDGT
jgi:hypothetical protein